MVKLSVRGSFIWVSIERIGFLGMQFISTVIYAMLLTPAEYGLIGIITIFIALSSVIVDSGMGGALIVKKNPNNTDFSTLFIYNLALSLILYVSIFFLAGFVADFYDEPILKLLLRILSLSIIFNAISIVQGIILIRELRFKELMFITFLSQVLSFFIGLFFAFRGYGVWTLVYYNISQSLLNTLGVVFVCKYKPSLIFSIKSFKSQFSFGVNLVCGTILKTISANIYSSAIGKVYSTATTGYYIQALKMQNVPVNSAIMIVDKAAFPILSKAKTDQEFIRQSNTINLYTIAIAVPILFLFSLMSETIILAIFGNKWIDSSEILSILCFVGVPLILQNLNRNIIKSKGNTKIILKIEIFGAIISLSMLFATIFISINAILWSMLVSNICTYIISVLYVRKIFNIAAQLKKILTPILLSVSLYLIFYFLMRYFQIDSKPRFITLCFIPGLYLIIYFALFIVFNKGIYYMIMRKIK